MPRLQAVIEDESDAPPAAHLLAGLRNGEPAAIAACYRAHADALLALAFRLTGTREDAEDVVHDVFVGLPNALKHYEERGTFLGWLKRVTARTALMHQRRVMSRRETPRDVDVFPSSNIADADFDNGSIRTVVTDALRTLSPALRNVFVLKIVEGQSHAEIARLLGISTAASEVRLNRAIKQLRKLLGGRS